jgi:hypothetical protein
VAACTGDASAAARATSWRSLKAHFTDRSLCFAKTASKTAMKTAIKPVRCVLIEGRARGFNPPFGRRFGRRIAQLTIAVAEDSQAPLHSVKKR